MVIHFTEGSAVLKESRIIENTDLRNYVWGTLAYLKTRWLVLGVAL